MELACGKYPATNCNLCYTIQGSMGDLSEIPSQVTLPTTAQLQPVKLNIRIYRDIPE